MFENGDRNTTYFYNLDNIKGINKKIDSVMDRDRVILENHLIEQHILGYFTLTFGTNNIVIKTL